MEKGVKEKVYIAYHNIKEFVPPEHRTSSFLKYRRDWEYYSSHFDAVRDFPMHVDIETTSYCNLLCPMCERTLMIQNGYPWENMHMDFNTFKKIIDEGVSNGLYAANISMVGEPMMNKDLTRMIGYAKETGVLDVMINTNATLLDREMSEDIIDSGLDKLIISFDAITPEKYEAIRKNAKFEIVVENIKTFMKIKKNKGKNLPVVRLYMTVMKENQDEVEEFCRFWEAIVDSIALNDYLNPLGLDGKNRYNRILEERNKKFVCPSLWQRLSIKVNGTVHPCCTDFGENLILGNIHSNALRECWESPKLKKFRQLQLEGRGRELKGCDKCDLMRYEY